MENDKYENMPDAVINLQKLPLKVALASFVTGTFLLFFFLVAPQKDPIIILGIWYVMLAFIVNLIALFIIIVLSFRHPAYQWSILKRVAMMVINIPIAYLYFIVLAKIIIG